MNHNHLTIRSAAARASQTINLQGGAPVPVQLAEGAIGAPVIAATPATLVHLDRDGNEVRRLALRAAVPEVVSRRGGSIHLEGSLSQGSVLVIPLLLR